MIDIELVLIILGSAIVATPLAIIMANAKVKMDTLHFARRDIDRLSFLHPDGACSEVAAAVQEKYPSLLVVYQHGEVRAYPQGGDA